MGKKKKNASTAGGPEPGVPDFTSPEQGHVYSKVLKTVGFWFCSLRCLAPVQMGAVGEGRAGWSHHSSTGSTGIGWSQNPLFAPSPICSRALAGCGVKADSFSSDTSHSCQPCS